MSTPGFGVPGTVALVAFGILFAAPFLAGRPEVLPPILFFAGLVLLSIEVFVTPGFGLLGVGGILLLLVSFVLAFQGGMGIPTPQSPPFQWNQLLRSLIALAVVLVVFSAMAWFLARFLPHVPVLGRLVLRPSTVSDGSSRGAADQALGTVQVGEEGVAESTLRPAGKAKFGARLVDVVAEGDFLDAGTRIRVIEVHGNRVVVKPVDNPQPAA